MLRSLKDLERYHVNATDGNIGHVEDFLFDDEQWTVRYLIAAMGKSFSERRVLISPISLRQADWSTRSLHVALTRQLVKNSPTIDVAKPVSRQQERDYYQYYGYPCYWGYAGLWGTGTYPGSLADGNRHAASKESSEETGDTHLRSANEVCGYHLQAGDEGIGHVDDFIIDEETWQVRYVVVDTSNWWFGKKVLVDPHWASYICWDERKVYIDLSRDIIKHSPEWNGRATVSHDYEKLLLDYYRLRWTPSAGQKIEESTLICHQSRALDMVSQV